jgi:hypothetical protein
MNKEILELTIVADTNDADYVTSERVIDQETLDRFMPVIEAIQQAHRQYNWETSEYAHGPSPESKYDSIDPDLIEDFNDEFVPYGEYGVHTITSIRVRRLVVLEETDYLK